MYWVRLVKQLYKNYIVAESIKIILTSFLSQELLQDDTLTHKSIQGRLPGWKECMECLLNLAQGHHSHNTASLKSYT